MRDLELFEVYFGQSAEPEVHEQQAKAVWEKIRLMSVSVFIPCEKKAFRRQAGGDVTDATRIESVKARFGPKLAPACSRHVESEACAGRREEMLEKKWGLFCKVMERCGRAVGPKNEEAYDAAMADAAMAAAGRSAGGPAGGNTTGAADGKEECWEFLSLWGNAATARRNASSAIMESLGHRRAQWLTMMGTAGSSGSMAIAGGRSVGNVRSCTSRR